MANSPSALDFNLTWAEFIATAVSDGTYSDVLVTTKVDRLAAAATEQAENSGQLWSNVVDDFVRATYPFFEGRNPESVKATFNTGVPYNPYTVTPGTDESVHFVARAYLKDPANAANTYLQKLEVIVTDVAGALTVTTISSAQYTGGTWTVTPGHLISAADYALRWTHNAAGDAEFDLHIDVLKTMRKA